MGSLVLTEHFLLNNGLYNAHRSPALGLFFYARRMDTLAAFAGVPSDQVPVRKVRGCRAVDPTCFKPAAGSTALSILSALRVCFFETRGREYSAHHHASKLMYESLFSFNN